MLQVCSPTNSSNIEQAEREGGREGGRGGEKEREGEQTEREREREWMNGYGLGGQWSNGHSNWEKASRLCVLRLCALKISKYAITTAACSLAVFNNEEREATINTSSKGTTS